MANMFNLPKDQKMFVQVQDGKKSVRDYFGFLELETDDFFQIRIDDKKKKRDYFYIIPKRLIIGIKLYWD